MSTTEHEHQAVELDALPFRHALDGTPTSEPCAGVRRCQDCLDLAREHARMLCWTLAEVLDHHDPRPTPLVAPVAYAIRHARLGEDEHGEARWWAAGERWVPLAEATLFNVSDRAECPLPGGGEWVPLLAGAAEAGHLYDAEPVVAAANL